jgi:hypothetical protein
MGRRASHNARSFAMMFFRATGYDRSELERAFAEYAEERGRELALEALERSTGVRDVASVPEHRIINGLTELICCFSFVGKAPKQSANNVARLHEALAAIREKAFARGK